MNRHADTRENRLLHAIQRLTRLYLIRRTAGRSTAHLLERCYSLSTAWLEARTLSH